MKKRLSTYSIVLIVIIAICLGLIFVENASAITGHATAWTWSNVTIAQYLAIEMSTNLSEGIDFGTINTLGAQYNATHNYNDSTGEQTKYWIAVSNDSNTAVDFCVYGNDFLSSGADVIGLGNETYATNTTVTNLTTPNLADEVTFTASNTKAANSVPVGNLSYWRFWLVAPTGQATGSYNNTVNFEGVNEGTACS